VVIVVDTCVAHTDPSRDGLISELEAIISLAAALSEAVTAQGYRLISLVTDDRIADLSHVGLVDQHRALLRLLAIVTPSGRRSCVARLEHTDFPMIPDVVFVLQNGETSAGSGGCDAILRDGAEYKRVVVARTAIVEATRVSPKRTTCDVLVSLGDIEAGRVEIR
jgi:hypothetical protein